MTKNITGSCFCQAVQYQISLPTLFCGHCHCSMCRRPHGASFVTWVGVPSEQFHVTQGVDNLTMYDSSAHGRRQFCKTCGSQLFCWHIDDDTGEPKLIDVTLASLQDEIDRLPDTHFYYDSRASWTVVEDDLPKLGGSTGVEPL